MSRIINTQIRNLLIGSSGSSTTSPIFLENSFEIIGQNQNKLKFDLSDATSTSTIIPPNGLSTLAIINKLTQNCSLGGSNELAVGTFQSSTFGILAGNALTFENSTGGRNSCFGSVSLSSCTTGLNNCAFGVASLRRISTSNDNCAFGMNAMTNTLTGNNNCAFGNSSLRNINGSLNCAIGFQSGSAISTGDNNVIVGGFVGSIQSGTLQNSVVIGCQSRFVTNTSNNILIGSNIDFGNQSNEIRIGAPLSGVGTFTKNFQSGIRNVIPSDILNGSQVFIDSKGQLGTITTKQLNMTNIQDMGDISTILNLRPVTFNWNSEINPSLNLNYGLVAEEVYNVYPDLVIRNSNQEIESVAYHILPILLLKEAKRTDTRILGINIQVSSLTDQINGFGIQFGNVNTNITSIGNSYIQLQTYVTTLSSSIETYNTTHTNSIDTLNSSLTSNANSITAINLSINNIQNSINDIQSDINLINNRFLTIESRLSALENLN